MVVSGREKSDFEKRALAQKVEGRRTSPLDLRNHKPFQALSVSGTGDESMNSKECTQRSLECADNAAVSVDETESLEFWRLAAQWRAMAARQTILGHVGDPPSRQTLPVLW